MEPLIEILSVAGSDSEQELIKLLDWNITAFSSKEIIFKVFYENPIEISQNSEPDLVTILLRLSEFTDEYGQSLA